MRLPVPRILLAAFFADLGMHVALGSFSYRATELGASPGSLGLAQGVADFVYFGVALLVPRFTDGLSRAKVVRCAALAIAAGAAICWQATSLGVFAGALVLARAGSAVFWPTLEARLSDEHSADLGSAVSMFSLSWACGKALGYGVNGFALWQALPPAGSFAITTGAALVLLAVAPRDHARPAEEEVEPGRRAGAFPLLRVRAAWVAVFLVCAAFVVLQNQNAPLMASKGHGGGFGNLMLAVLVAVQFLMFEVLRRKPELAGSDRALVVSLGLIAAGLLAVWLTSVAVVMLGAVALIGAGMGLAYTQSLFLSLRLPHKKSVAAGIHEAFIGIANAVVAPLAGIATERAGNANGALLFALALTAAGGSFVVWCVLRARRDPMPAS
jgi:predicted MFS family arabinose efflux permease